MWLDFLSYLQYYRAIVPRLPLSFFLAYFHARNIEGEGEPGAERRPPVARHGGHALHCAQYRSRAALWIKATSPRSGKDSKFDCRSLYGSLCIIFATVAILNGDLAPQRKKITGLLCKDLLAKFVMIHKAARERYCA